MNDNKLVILKEVFHYGFSAVLALLAIILIYLGLIGEAKMPEALIAGLGILVFSILFYIGELTLKIIKIKKEKSKSKE